MKYSSTILVKAFHAIPMERRRVVETIFPSILKLSDNKNPFPIDLENDYTRFTTKNKNNVANRIVRRHFQEGRDYITKAVENGGRPKLDYFVSIPVFKTLLLRDKQYQAVMVDYFSVCERIALETVANDVQPTMDVPELMQYLSDSTVAENPSFHDEVVERLVDREGGRKEVQTGVGRADVVNNVFVIEVKVARLWKHALGQALAYSVDTGLLPRVHLYGGKLSPEAIAVFNRLNVTVTFESTK